MHHVVITFSTRFYLLRTCLARPTVTDCQATKGVVMGRMMKRIGINDATENKIGLGMRRPFPALRASLANSLETDISTFTAYYWFLGFVERKRYLLRESAHSARSQIPQLSLLIVAFLMARDMRIV